MVFPASEAAEAALRDLGLNLPTSAGAVLQAAAERGLPLDAFAYVANRAVHRLLERAHPESRLLLRHPGGIDPGLAEGLASAPLRYPVRVVESLEGRLLHAKLYAVHLSGGRKLVLVGSSNATTAGLYGNLEANVALLLDGATPPQRDPHRAFLDLWEQGQPYDPRLHRPEPLLQEEARGLFEYQEEALRSLEVLRRAIREADPEARPTGEAVPGCLVALPTAAGKTLLASQFVLRDVLPKEEGQGYRKVLWLAETYEQLQNARRSLERDLSPKAQPQVRLALYAPEIRRPFSELAMEAEVVLCARALLARRLEAESQRALPRFDLVVIDEAHHVHRDNEGYPTILGRIPHLARLGISATPHRHPIEDDPGLYAYFNPEPDHPVPDRPHFERTLAELEGTTHRGVRIFARAEYQKVQTHSELDLSGISSDEELKAKRGATFTKEARIRTIAEAYQKDLHRPALFFAVDVADANALTEALLARGVRAQSVHTGSPVSGALFHSEGAMGIGERARMIEALRASPPELDALVSVDVFVEGVDIPELQSVFIARPTFSPRVYLQMRGRGMRGPATSGTERCFVVHFQDDLRNEAADRRLQDEERALAHERGVRLEAERPGKVGAGSFLAGDLLSQVALVANALRGQGEQTEEAAIDLVSASLGMATTSRRGQLREQVAQALREAALRGAVYRIRLNGRLHYKAP